MHNGTVRETFKSLLEVFVNRKPERVLFTTFNLNPPFFENNVLPLLAGSAPGSMSASSLNTVLAGTQIAVFCDRTASPYPKGAVRYALVPVGLEEGRFHPKVVIAEGVLAESGKRGVALMVASANLTLAGWGLNREVAGWTMGRFRHVEELDRLLGWLDGQCSFLGENQIEDLFDPREFIGKLRETASKAPPDNGEEAPDFLVGLPGDSKQSGSDSAEFKAGESTKDTLLSRMKGEGDHDSLTVISPYWGSVSKIIAGCGASSISFIPSYCRGKYSFPVASLKENCDCSFLKLPLDENRFSHAKMYLWRSGRYARLAVGSANCTGPALLGEGNVEAMLVYHQQTGSKAFSLATEALPPYELTDEKADEENGAIPILPFEVMVVRDWKLQQIRCHFNVFSGKPLSARLIVAVPGQAPQQLLADQWDSPLEMPCRTSKRINTYQIHYTYEGKEFKFRGVVIDLNASAVDLGFERRELLDDLLEELHLRSRGRSVEEPAKEDDSEQYEPDDGEEKDDAETPADACEKEEPAGEELGPSYDFFAMYRGFSWLQQEIEKGPPAPDGLGPQLPRLLRAVVQEQDERLPARIRRYLVLTELLQSCRMLPEPGKESKEKAAFAATLQEELEKSRAEMNLLLSQCQRFQVDFPGASAAGSFVEWFEREIQHDA